jgi:hypothetical protein
MLFVSEWLSPGFLILYSRKSSLELETEDLFLIFRSYLTTLWDNLINKLCDFKYLQNLGFSNAFWKKILFVFQT